MEGKITWLRTVFRNNRVNPPVTSQNKGEGWCIPALSLLHGVFVSYLCGPPPQNNVLLQRAKPALFLSASRPPWPDGPFFLWLSVGKSYTKGSMVPKGSHPSELLMLSPQEATRWGWNHASMVKASVKCVHLKSMTGLKTAVLEYNLYVLKVTFSQWRWLSGFLHFVELCGHHHNLILKHFHYFN